ncbi:Pimeloyl-ACP methyl ester carboxylesterase [Enhydrobacter aerosaccus]|uniref:Pimeloyl-ACP methyl ester carboxylesterase n=1 Tax=Enhydrobacter aerosaccus TaxID=225324 RepID=A0A1T4PRF2_9HYPH|nr:alpha/beta hydrolase [Enhydrobacter aerosaccus]SJZ93488.1 Pimeloyl-ACP methyl ester carboxylesterase [Enhydrobacter aerosaccus]
MPPSDDFIDLGDRTLRVRRLEPQRSDGLERTTLIFLHEGLGCIEMWRDFPQKLCDATQCTGLIYDRTAYGQSSPWPSDPGVRYMEIEADLILPKLLAATGIEDCVLVGHSDGGTIALNYAAADPEPLRAVTTLAAHAINEPICVDRIRDAQAAFTVGDLRQRLLKYHGDNVDRAFHLWADAWSAPGFQPMDADGRLPGIQVPVQAIQGEDDEYGTELQLGIIAGKVGGYCETRLVPDCGHSPHLQQPAYVLSEIARFIAPLALLG